MGENSKVGDDNSDVGGVKETENVEVREVPKATPIAEEGHEAIGSQNVETIQKGLSTKTLVRDTPQNTTKEWVQKRFTEEVATRATEIIDVTATPNQTCVEVPFNTLEIMEHVPPDGAEEGAQIVEQQGTTEVSITPQHNAEQKEKEAKIGMVGEKPMESISTKQEIQNPLDVVDSNKSQHQQLTPLRNDTANLSRSKANCGSTTSASGTQ
ncbi:hypothetical protein K7X08_032393 [Anisodus acutangulus]|uniref:Uncharacterized protein n=1 Tax=Anisodus acutangulus TaxID=402998 RepID=A0A9Q1LWX8_9SOLA|nr:hypothetical protein K7X08_032393 [Anisodus acutangulus]